MSQALYSTQVMIQGVREGRVQSTDGKLEANLAPPKELGGPEKGSATNPEQLFAAGYGTCFESAVRFVARQQGISLSTTSVLSEVSLYKREVGGFQIAVTLKVSLPGVDLAIAEKLIREAHTNICPYSHATRNSIEVKITVG